ncbi:MAG: ribonuclease BN [Bradyrhizobium sp.]|jgi:membrane protein|nr:ribonuclease BN [Bradyrhizobium sp.]
MTSSRWPNNLALVAATAMATVAIYRQVSVREHDEANARSAPASGAAVMADVGRGRLARAPWQIPFAGWKDILYRTFQQINEDRVLATAAGVVFYGLLAIFPAITALVSSYALFADPSTITDNLRSLSLMMPDGSFGIIQDQVGRVLSKGSVTLGWTFLIGLAMAIWSANAGMKAILDALNVVYEEDEKRSFIKLNLVSLSFTVAALAGILIMVSAVVAVPLLLQGLGLGTRAELIISVGRWPILAFLLLFALATLYRYGPSRATPRWQWLSVGAILAVVLWLAGSAILSWYLANFEDYDATYGSLGAAIGLMIWMWMSAIIVLCGAELNSEIEHQTAIDSTEGRQKPLGTRGAAMADTVGERTSAS